MPGPSHVRTIVRTGARFAKWGTGPDDGVDVRWTASSPEEVREAEERLRLRDARRVDEDAARRKREADPVWQAADRIRSWFGARETDKVMRLGADRLARIEVILLDATDKEAKP